MAIYTSNIFLTHTNKFTLDCQFVSKKTFISSSLFENFCRLKQRFDVQQ